MASVIRFPRRTNCLLKVIGALTAIFSMFSIIFTILRCRGAATRSTR